MAGRLADRIQAERRRQFVGRQEELQIFARTVSSDRWDIVVLNVHGPGGVGKTTLLRQFEAYCEDQGAPYVTVDARNLQPTPESFLAVLALATGQESPEQAIKSFADTRRKVLFLDTYEAIEPIDSWVRDQFLPQLPENVLVVMLGRKRPGASWRSDVWQSLSRTIALRNLSDQDVGQYLTAFAIPHSEHSAILKFTRGYPLALSLVAENFTQRGEVGYLAESSPDVLELLLDRFLEGVTDPDQREALELCALVRNTTEALLEDAFKPVAPLGQPAGQPVDLQTGRASALFAWLRGLSFIEETAQGLMPHDLARETIANELRWRNADRYSALHHRARSYYANRLERATGEVQRAILFDYIYLHRYSPMVQPFFQWNSSPSAFVDQARPEDESEILRLVTSHEGHESAEIARYWWSRQPENFLVLRDSSGESNLKGLLVRLRIDSIDTSRASTHTGEEDVHDPAIEGAMRVIETAPLNPRDQAIHFRFWMTDDGYQNVGPVQSVIFVAIVQHIFDDPTPAMTFLSFAVPEFWSPMFAYAMFRRAPEADYTVGSRTYGVFTVDWRAMTPKTWLDRLGEQEVPIKDERSSRRETAELVVLSREGFEQSVLDALKSFTNAGRLSESPLLASRLVIDRVGAEADLKAKVLALRTLLFEVAQTLNTNPKDAKLFQALEAGYLRPQRSQELAAEKVDVAIATFRRHLKSAISRVTDVLWQQETGV